MPGNEEDVWGGGENEDNVGNKLQMLVLDGWPCRTAHCEMVGRVWESLVEDGVVQLLAKFPLDPGRYSCLLLLFKFWHAVEKCAGLPFPESNSCFEREIVRPWQVVSHSCV